MNRITRGLAVILLGVVLSVTTLALPMTASAAPASGSGSGNGGSSGSSGARCGTTKTFFNWNCSSTTDDDNAISDVLVQILNWAAAGVVVAVVGGLIYGAIVISSASGDQVKMKSGVSIIRNALIALVLYFLMYAGLNFVIPGGLFT